MVRWGRLSPELPEVLLDFKRALRSAINNAGFSNLGELAKSTGIPDSTLSDAAGSSPKLPTADNLRMILASCRSKAPADARYDGWPELYKLACEAAKDVATRRGARSASKRPPRSDERASPSENFLPAREPHLAVHDPKRDVWVYTYTETSTALLIDRMYPRREADFPEARDE